METKDISIAKTILWMRLSQMIINEKYKADAFKIPIHLAMGHEAIAVALDSVMQESDQLACSHRNMHYNLARTRALKPILDEYLLKKEGLAKAELGSMNLASEARNIVYSSSILGNNLPVATGLALAKAVKKDDGIVFVVTGDGAMEEGTFYESLLFMQSNKLRALIIVENNKWSMHTKIDERRCPIDIAHFVTAFGAGYEKFSGNDVYDYTDRLQKLRERIMETSTPTVLEVDITTLGGWHVEKEGGGDRFIHPHAGPIPKIDAHEWPELEHNACDPVFVLTKHFPADSLKKLSQETLVAIKKEINES